MKLLSDIRKRYNGFMLDTKSINTIMTKKVEEYVLMNEQPLPIFIGNKVIYVGNFTYDTEQLFFRKWGMLIGALSAKIINMELSDVRRKELLERGNFELLANGKYMLEFLLMDNWLKKQICRLLKKTLLKQSCYIMTKEGIRKFRNWKNCSYRYFKKNITKETLIQMMFLIYMYNFDAQKKSLKLVAEKMQLKELAESYIPFWLQNLAGLEGKFQLAQVPSIDHVFRDKLNVNIPPLKGKNDGDK